MHINVYAQSGGTSFLYEHETSYGILQHTKGFGASLQFTKHKTADKYRLLDFNFYSVKHPKEIRLPNRDQVSSRSFVYGKLNSLFVLKANYGARRILADRLAQNTVRINLNYSFGPVLGILKPVYYDVKVLVRDPNPNNPDGRISKEIPFRFDEEENSYMQMNTVGYANFGYGIGESTFMFGANAKTSVSFEWGREDNKFYSLETGLMVDAFPKDVPIFAYINNDQVFVNLFFALSYGTRR
jgi:hypothetical protein